MVPFEDDSSGQPAVRGFLHHPAQPSGDTLVLTHGVGANCRAPLLVAVASAFAEAGVAVLRCDLPFRQQRPHGPPFPGSAREDREGLRRAIEVMRKPGRVFLGGHSYGGRQATILAAAEPTLVEGLFLLAYPLHPPRRPSELRTSHFPDLRARTLFVHGSRDPFGSLEEMEEARKLIPAPTSLLAIEGAGHDLSLRRKSESGAIGLSQGTLAQRALAAFLTFFGSAMVP